MSDRMPGEMADRLSGKMSDSMSEYVSEKMTEKKKNVIIYVRIFCCSGDPT